MNLLKVLIVDDEYLIRNLIRMRINWEENGMVIVGEAGYPEEAFQMVEELRPDIIFTDICMPTMDGIEFASCVLEKHPEIRIAVITGHDDFDFMQRSIRAGIIDYLLKPIKQDELLEATMRMKSSIERERSLTEKELKNYPQKQEMHPLISRVLEYMNENMENENLNVNDVAELFFVSRGHLSRLMKQETGKTFVEQLTSLRLERAKQLLKNENLTSYEVGEKVGIKDAHYFSILFKKWSGMSPNQYRRSQGF